MLEAKNVLKEFGMSENETQIYIILLKLGSATASEIAGKSGVHRINVYDILERLQERGLISYVIKGKTKYYEATDPKKILQLEDEKRENLNKIIPRLEEFMRMGKNPQEATIYKDRAGIKNIIDEHTHSKTPVYLFSSGWGFKQNFPDYFDIYHSRLERNKVKLKTLLSNKFKNIKLPKVYDIRYLPSEFVFPSTTVVYEDKVLIIMWSSDPIAILVRGKEIADSYKEYFSLLWKIAKK